MQNMQRTVTAEGFGEVMESVLTAEAVQKWVDETVGAGIGWVMDEVVDPFVIHKMDICSVNTRSHAGQEGLYLFLDLYRGSGEHPRSIYVELDLKRGMLYSMTGPLSPFVIIFDLVFRKNFGHPLPVQFPNDPELPNKEEVNNFESMKKGMNWWLFG